MRDDHRMSGGRPHRSLEAERGQFVRQPFGRGLAVAGEGGIGRNGLDRDQLEQPGESGFEIGVDLVQNRVERCHELFPAAVKKRRAALAMRRSIK